MIPCGHQEGRFFHGYYDCYCYLPLYVFCGRHLLAAKLRRSNIDASAGAKDEVERIITRMRAHWPRVKILLRADSGFARDELMAWCEAHGVDYLARTERLVGAIAADLAAAEAESLAQGGPARRFADFAWRTLDSWSCARRVIGKAEHLAKGPNPRFIVTSLSASALAGQPLYEGVYCARGAMENRMYGRLPLCKQVSSSLRHAWSAAAMYPAC
jgi:Transposase DDE domain group 1